MRAAAAAVAALAGLLVPAGAAAPPKPVHPISPIAIRPIGTATANAVPAAAGAQPAGLTVTLRLEMQCGRPRPGPIVVALPAAMSLPAQLLRTDVRIDTRMPATLSLTKHVVVLTPPRTSGITCDSIGPGTLSVVFLQSAGLGNPASPGTYPVTIRSGGSSAVAHLIVS
jgi:hypothetical protein